MNRLLERVVANHVTQHPPDVGGLAAVITLIESRGQGLTRIFLRRGADFFFRFDKRRPVKVQETQSGGAPILLLLAIDRLGKVREAFVYPRPWRRERCMHEFVNQVHLDEFRVPAGHGR